MGQGETETHIKVLLFFFLICIIVERFLGGLTINAAFLRLSHVALTKDNGEIALLIMSIRWACG